MIAVTTSRHARRPGPEIDRLREFLATHDAECPACGYNLRGNTEGACPECGRGISLGVEVRDALARRHGLLLLLFLWLLLAGLMNSVRAGREINLTASQVSVQRIIASFPGTTTGGGITAPPVNGSPIIWKDRVLLSGATATGAGTGTGTFLIGVVPSAGPARNWASVTWRQWARFAGWSLLGGLAVTGLVLLWHARRAQAGSRLGRALLALAWTGFGGYFMYHASVFVMELV